MKEYIKPEIEAVDLKIEAIASVGTGNNSELTEGDKVIE